MFAFQKRPAQVDEPDAQVPERVAILRIAILRLTIDTFHSPRPKRPSLSRIHGREEAPL
jgi:hypothetical protein